MKTVRILLLMLLVMVLPLRGALADAVSCVETSAPTGQTRMAAHTHLEHGAHAGVRHDAVPGSALMDLGDPTGLPGGPIDTCQFCTTFCSTAPFMSATLRTVAPLAGEAVAFPMLTAPPPSHASGAQDRPPRRV